MAEEEQNDQDALSYDYDYSNSDDEEVLDEEKDFISFPGFPLYLLFMQCLVFV